MHISEVPVGGQLTVIASLGNKSIELKTVAKQSFNGSLLVERLTNFKNQPVSFAVKGLEITIIYVNKDRKPIIWKDVKIRHITIEDESFHRIIQSTTGKETERRSSPRVFLGDEAVLRIGLSQKGIPVRIKDLSQLGISFVSDGNVNYEGSILHISIKNGSGMLNLSANVVRKRALKGKNSFVYGCVLSNNSQPNTELDSFLVKMRSKNNES